MTRAEMRALREVASQDQNGEHPSADLPRKLKETFEKVEGPGQSLISRFGPPAIPNREGHLTKIYEPFWARLYAHEQPALYEPNEGQFYDYNAETGLFQVQTVDMIRKKLVERIEKASKEWAAFAGLRKFCAEATLRGVISQLRGELERVEAFRFEKRIVHLANCVLAFQEDGSFTVEKFSSDFRSRNQSPIAYDPDATCPKFTEALLGHLDQDDRELVQKYAGQCALGRNLTQQILLLEGVGGSSKSALVLVIRGIVGVVNAMELRTKHLEDRFEIGRMVGKTLLLGSDAKSDFLSGPGVSRLKSIVGGDVLDAELKGSNKRITVNGNFNVAITSNSRLRVRLEGDQSAWKRRLLIVRYERPYRGKAIPEIHQLLLREEGPGILNWCLEGIKKLLADIAGSGRIVLSDSQRERIETLLSESDSLRIFLRENIAQTSGPNLTVAEIIEAYNKHCIDCGWAPVPSAIAQRQLDDLMLELFSVAKVNNVPRDGKAQRGFRNVRLRPANEADPDDPE